MRPFIRRYPFATQPLLWAQQRQPPRRWAHVALPRQSLNDLLKQTLQLPPSSANVPLGSSAHIMARLAAAGRVAASQLAQIMAENPDESGKTRASPPLLHPAVVLELLRHVLRAEKDGALLLQPLLEPLSHAGCGERFVQILWLSLTHVEDPQLRCLVRQHTMLVFTGILRLAKNFPSHACGSVLRRMCWEGMLEWERCLDSDPTIPTAELRSVPPFSSICDVLEFALRGLEQLTLSSNATRDSSATNSAVVAGASLCARLCVLLFHLRRKQRISPSAVPPKAVPWAWFSSLPQPNNESIRNSDSDSAGEDRLLLTEYRSFVLQDLLFPIESCLPGDFSSCGAVLRTSATADLLHCVLHAPQSDGNALATGFALPLVVDGAPSAVKQFLLQLASVRGCAQTAVCLDVTFSCQAEPNDMCLGCIAPLQCWLQLLTDSTASDAPRPATGEEATADPRRLAARTMQVSFASLLDMIEGWVGVLKAMVTCGEPRRLLDQKPRVHQLLSVAQCLHTCLLNNELFFAHFPGARLQDAERRIRKSLGDARWLVRRVMTLKSEALREDRVLGAVLTGGVSLASEPVDRNDQLLKQIGHRVVDPLLKQWYARRNESAAALREVGEVRHMLERCVGHGRLTAEEHFTLRHPMQCSITALVETWRCVAVKLLLLRDWGRGGDAAASGAALDIVTDAAEIAMELLAAEVEGIPGDDEESSARRNGLLRMRTCVSLAWQLLLLQHAAQCGSDNRHLRDAVTRNFRKGVLALAVEEGTRRGDAGDGPGCDESDWNDLGRRDWELRERLLDYALDPESVRNDVVDLHCRCCRDGERGDDSTRSVVWSGGDLVRSIPDGSAVLVLPWSARAFAFQPLRLYDEDKSSARSLEIFEFELQQLMNSADPRTQIGDEDDNDDDDGNFVDRATGTGRVNANGELAARGVNRVMELTFVDELTLILLQCKR